MTGNCRAIAFCFLSLAGPLAAHGSQLAPPRSPTTADAPNTQSSAYQLSVKVRRVVLDVVVTDANGNPVMGLKADDFKVWEDGVVQPLHFFDVHTGAAAGASQQALDLHLPSDTFSNLTVAPADKPVTILLYDMVDTPQSSLSSTHQAMVKFIKKQKGSASIAIFVLTDRLHMLQGFTEDETRLMKAINSKRATSQAPPLRAAPFAEDAFEDEMLLRAESEELTHLGTKRNRIAVDAFIEIARLVSVLPGRKNLIWMSGSFPPEIFSRGTMLAGARRQVLLDPDVRAAKQLLDESRVAVYPVDANGLQVDPQFSAATSYTAPPGKSFFGRQQGAEHAAMDVIAESTGGRAFYNTNGLQEAMDTAVRQGSVYYTLTYAPTNTKADGGERNIKVVLKYPGYQLSYRRSYLADDARHPSPMQSLALDISMQHGAPNSSELFFEATVNPVGGAMAASAEEIESFNTFLPAKTTGSPAKLVKRPEAVQHYDINFSILGRLLDMPPTQDGWHATNLRFGLAAYSEDGQLLNASEVNIKNSIPEDRYQKIASEGYHASILFAVPEGAVSLRMAVRDEIGKRIGTLEIPLPLPISGAAVTPKR